MSLFEAAQLSLIFGLLVFKAQPTVMYTIFSFLTGLIGSLLLLRAWCWTLAITPRDPVVGFLPIDPALAVQLAQEGPVEELRICPLCGRAFLPKRRQLYCSQACQAEANRRKSRERMRNRRRDKGHKRYD